MKYFTRAVGSNTLKCETNSEKDVALLVSVGWKEVSKDEYEQTIPVYQGKEPEVDESTLIKAQIQAQSDRADFIEDCIAEMAMQIYN